MRSLLLYLLLTTLLVGVELPLIHRVMIESGDAPQIKSSAFHLRDFEFQEVDGEWITLLPFGLKITDNEQTKLLKEVPIGTYKAVRFSIFQPKNSPAGHLNIRSETASKTLSLKNHPHLPRIHLSTWFVVQENTPLRLTLNLDRLLSFPRPIPLDTSLNQETLNSALIANLHSAFSLTGSNSLIPPLHFSKNNTPISLDIPPRFAPPGLPPDNPLTKERVALGEKLFFDGIISADGSVTCGACHSENNAFAEDRAISRGFEGRLGKANSMPLFNRAWKSSFFWNGRAPTIRDQVLRPIAHRQEMAIPIKRALFRLNRRRDYQRDFTIAFGPGQITAEKLSLALESFILTLTSFDSKFDQAMMGKAELTAREKRGMDLFFNDHVPGKPGRGAGCYQCHGGANFTDYQFHNNGLLTPKDDGLFEVTGRKEDLKKFITPSLRNLVHTKPYSHDGRLLTLEEVIDHYSNPPKLSETLDPRLPKKGLQLSEPDQAALIAFLKTLSDPKY
ncbi:MAG: cytochrome c peroxidase [Akkermansiaceae bacterium]